MHISEYEIPKVSVSESRTVEHSSSVVIMCNLTEDAISRQRTPLKRISWYKNGELLQSVRNPDPNVPGDFLAPLYLPSVNVKDGGTYECLLEFLKCCCAGSKTITSRKPQSFEVRIIL